MLIAAGGPAAAAAAAPERGKHRTVADPIWAARKSGRDRARTIAPTLSPTETTAGLADRRGSYPTSIERGLAWLEGAQNSDGSWGSDNELIQTATTLETVATLDPCIGPVSGAESWLASGAAPNNDAMARRMTGLAGIPGDEALSLDLAYELLARRNPSQPNATLPNWPEGGWGLAEGYETDSLTTALALIALGRAGFDGGLKAIDTQLAAGATSVHEWNISADALEARIVITVADSTVRLRMTQGRVPGPFDPYFSLPPGGPYLIVFPDSGLAFTPGTNYIAIESPNPPALPATYTMTASYETPSFDTRSLDEALEYLRQSQNGDGGWGIQRGQATELYTSLHVLLCLLRYPRYDFDGAIGAGIAYLESQQLPDGSFGYEGSTVPYVTGLASIALIRSEGGPFGPATEAAVSALSALQQADGSWAHEAYDTSLAMLAIWEHGRPPSAEAGVGQGVVDVDGNCVETVSLSGSGTALNPPITGYEWTSDCAPLASGAAPTVVLPAGTHVLVLTVTDNAGLTGWDRVEVTVDASGATVCIDADGDGVLDDGDGSGVAGDAPCSFGHALGCDDNCRVTPNSGQEDPDGDGRGTACDCDGGNAQVWAFPSEVSLILTHSKPEGRTDIAWSASGDPGGSMGVRYDTLRSGIASDFTGGATCLETDQTDTQASDASAPGNGGRFFYLVRAENDCPGGGSLGVKSSGDERTGRTCP